MKYYPKIYENVFRTNRTKNLKKFDQIRNFHGLSLPEYAQSFKSLFDDFDEFWWKAMVKYIWLTTSIIYIDENGNEFRKDPGVRNRGANLFLGFFVREVVGNDCRLIYSINIHRVVKRFVFSFYPDLDKIDPFKDEIKYPYKYMNLSCLFLVSKMDEFREIADYGEEQKMSHLDFLDYVVNHINCVNEELGREKYAINLKRGSVPFVSMIPEDKNKNFPYKNKYELKKEEYAIKRRIKREEDRLQEGKQ